MSDATPRLIITEQGLAAASIALPEGPYLHITKFRIGSGYGYTPTTKDTDMVGNLLFEGVPSSYANIDSNTKNIICKIPADSGPYDFGEISLWLETGEMFAKAVFTTPQTKLTSLGTNLLSTYTLNCLLQLAASVASIKVDTLEGATLLTAELWSDVIPPAKSSNPDVQQILVKELDLNGNSSLVHQADPNQWTIGTNYHYVTTASIISATVNTITIDGSTIDPSLYATTNRQYVIETADGYLRSALSFALVSGNGLFTLNPADLPEVPIGTIKIHSNLAGTGGGGAGAPGVSANLTSSSVVLSAANDGTVTNYLGAATSLIISEGGVNTTNLWTIDAAASPGVSITPSIHPTGNTIGVVHIETTTDSGIVTFTATRTGYTNIVKIFNIAKAKAGSDGTGGGGGSAGVTASLSVQSFVLPASTDGTVSSYAGCSSSMQVLEGANDTTGSWLIDAIPSSGVSISPTTHPTGGTATVTYLSPTVDIGTITFTATRSGYSSLVKVFSVTKAKAGVDGSGGGGGGTPGASAVAGTLTSSSFTLPAASDGTVTSFTGCTTTIQILEGPTDVTNLWTIDTTVSSGMTISQTTHPTGATATVNSINPSVDTGTVTFTCSRSGYPLITKVFNVSKAKAGAGGGTAGKDGISASLTKYTVQLPADANGHVAPGAGYAGGQTTMRVYIGATDDTANWSYSASSSSGSLTFNQTGNTISITGIADGLDQGQITITATKSGLPNMQLVFVVSKAQIGASGVSGVTVPIITLIKDNWVAPANPSGTVTSYNGAQTVATVFLGQADDSSHWTFSNSDSSGITSQLTGTTLTITNVGSTTDSGTVTITATPKPERNTYSPIVKQFSISKAKSGADGASGNSITMNLSKDAWVFAADAAGNITTTLSAFTAITVYLGTTDDTSNWTFSRTNSAGVTSTLSGNGVQIDSFANNYDVGVVTITATRSGYPTISKQFALSKAKAGTPGSGAGGVRGSQQFFLPNHTSWSDADATTAASVFGGPVNGDGVTEYNLGTPQFSDYRVWNGTSWVAQPKLVNGVDIMNGTIAGTKFASTIQPVGIVNALPDPNGYTGPSTVFLTTDKKLYRYTGTGWTAMVPSLDILGQLTDSQLAQIAAAKLTGQITSTQITDGAISTPKIFAGAITAAVIAADTITASQIAANAITASELAVGSVTTNKILAGAVTAHEILADTITAGQIAVGAIGASEIAANAITAAAIAALAITGDKIVGNTITAGNMATGTITALSGVIANAAVNTLQIAGNAVTQAVAFSQDPQVEINSSFSWANICTSTIQLSGGQPLLITASCLIAGAHLGTQADHDNVIIDNGVTTYWKFNSTISGADFQFQVFNGGAFAGITAVSVSPAVAAGVPIFAILPGMGAGTYTIYLQAKLNGPQPVGVRQSRMMLLETKR